MHISIRNHSFHRPLTDKFPKIWAEGERKAHCYWLSNLDFISFSEFSQWDKWGCDFLPCSHFQNAHISKSLKSVTQRESIWHCTWTLYYSTMAHLKRQNSDTFSCHLGEAQHSQPPKQGPAALQVLLPPQSPITNLIKRSGLVRSLLIRPTRWSLPSLWIHPYVKLP